MSRHLGACVSLRVFVCAARSQMPKRIWASYAPFATNNAIRWGAAMRTGPQCSRTNEPNINYARLCWRTRRVLGWRVCSGGLGSPDFVSQILLWHSAVGVCCVAYGVGMYKGGVKTGPTYTAESWRLNKIIHDMINYPVS